MITKETLQKLSAALPSGARSRVAQKLNISKQIVTNALKGRLRGEKGIRILEELYKEASSYKKTVNGISDTINSLS